MTGGAARWPAVVALAPVLVVVLLGLVGPLPSGARAAEAPPPERAGPVVVVGVPGLSWQQVDEQRTPALWDLVGRGSAGSLSVRSAAGTTCPADGWLSLGAGNRALATSPGAEGCDGQPEVVDRPGGTASVPAFPDLVAANAELTYRARLGLLAEQVGAGAGCVAAVGPGAALAAADGGGRVQVHRPLPAVHPGAPPPDAPGLGPLGAALRECAVTLVEAPAALDAADDVVRRVDEARPDGSTLLVVGTGARPAARRPGDTLQVALEVGPAAEPGSALVSPSTRRAPYVQLIDVAPTVLARLDQPAADAAAGQPWRPAGEAEPAGVRVAGLADVERLAVAHRRLAVPAATVLVAVPVLLLVAAAVAAGRRPRAARRATVAVAVAAGGVPAATFLANLVPWWRAPAPLPALLVAVAVPALALAALALAGPWRRHPLGPVGVVAAATALVLAADVVTGSRLQMSSVLGHSPLVAGRFAGFSNLAFGVFAAAVLLAGAAAAAMLRGRRLRDGDVRLRRAAVAAVVAAAVVVDGAPSWGSDVGGVLALVPAGVLLVLLATGARVSWARLAVATAAGAGVVAVLATLDALRPTADQSHLGRFALQVVRGEAGPVLARKLSANAALLTENAATAAVPVLLTGLALLVLRPGAVRAGALARAYAAVPELRAGLVAVLAVAVLGALANDSGVGVVAAAFLVAAPLGLAAVLLAGARTRGARLPKPRGPAVTVDSRGRAG